MKQPQVIDAEYRVVGEGRWAPFRRWLAEMRFKVIAAVLGPRVASQAWWRQVLYVLILAVGFSLTAFAARVVHDFLETAWPR